MTDRAHAVGLDQADVLAPFVERFHPPGGQRGTVYLDGNSLGPQPREAAGAVDVELQRWRSRLIRGWNERWLELVDEASQCVAALVGAPPDALVVGDSTTVCLYKAASAAIRAAPLRPDILTDRGNFPTDLYVLGEVATAAGGRLRVLDAPPTADRVAAEIDGRVGLVALSHVDFRTGELLALAEITEVTRRAGARSLWDLSHSAGVVPVDLGDAGVDLAIGCTYKYLYGGPGSPAYLYVRPDLAGELQTPIPGWFGHADPFAMEPSYRPAPGADRFRAGTPPVLSIAALVPGLRIVAEAGAAAIRAKSVALTHLAIALADAWLAPLGATVVTPRVPARRGGHVALRFPDARAVSARLVADHGVIGDARQPDILRLGLSPLHLRFVDVHDGLARIAAALREERPAPDVVDLGPVP